MKYRITILIIIIISLGKNYHRITHTSRTHACTDVRTRTLAHTHTLTHDRGRSLCRCAQPWLRHGRAHPFRRWRDNGRSATHCNKLPASKSVCTIVWVPPRVILGRTEARTRDRVYCQTIRSVRDIYRDDRARIATCILRTLTDRHKKNYSI